MSNKKSKFPTKGSKMFDSIIEEYKLEVARKELKSRRNKFSYKPKHLRARSRAGRGFNLEVERRLQYLKKLLRLRKPTKRNEK